MTQKFKLIVSKVLKFLGFYGQIRVM